MIHEVDSALRALIERDAVSPRDVEVVFDAPTREWSARRSGPTVDVYLYDIREDTRRRERGLQNEYDDRVRVIGRHLPPRHFKLSYLVTAWTQRPEDEHRLLSSLLGCFTRYEALPVDLLVGPLAELGLPVPLTVALPPPEDRSFADVWTALGGELKPSIDVVVSAPMDTGQRFPVGPPVTAAPMIGIQGTHGWPGREERTVTRGSHAGAGGGDDGPAAAGSGDDAPAATREHGTTGSDGTTDSDGTTGSDDTTGTTGTAAKAGRGRVTMRRQRSSGAG